MAEDKKVQENSRKDAHRKRAEDKAAAKKKKQEEKIKLLPNMLYILQVIWESSRLILFTKPAVSLISNSVWSVYSTYYLAYMLDQLNNPKANVSFLFLMLALMAAVSGVTSLMSNSNTIFLTRRVLNDIYLTINNRIYRKAASVDMGCFEDPEFYDKYIKAVNESYTRASDFLDNSGAFFSDFGPVLISLSFILISDPFLLVFAGVSLIFPVLLGDKLNKLNKKLTDDRAPIRRRRDYIRRTVYLSNFAKEMRLSNMAKLMFSKFKTVLDDDNKLRLSYAPRIFVWELLVYEVGFIFSFMLPFAYITYRAIAQGAYAVGTSLALVNAVQSLRWRLQSSITQINKITEACRFFDNLRVFLNYDSRVKSMPDGVRAKIIPGGSGLSVKNLTFTYTGKEKPTLENINMEIKPGQKAAIVGINGAGKTTLVKLLMRLYDADCGEIRLDGRVARDYELDSYRSVFGTVFQDFQLFSMSLAENILMRPVITGEDRALAEKCIGLAGLSGKVSKLEKGMDTILTREFDDEGAVFSGGEGQKTAIARIFARPCGVVILDEPTSALDPIAENEMYNNMMTAARDKTLIFISHRLSSTRDADIIFVLDQGRIIESGRHAELMALGGKYAEMFSKQAERYAGARQHDEEEAAV